MVRYKALLLGGAVAWLWLFGLAADSARASPMNANLVSIVPDAGVPGTFLWTYSASTATGERVEVGDFFAIYDFLGFLGDTFVQANWTFTSPNVGPVALGTTPLIPDNPGVTNLVMTFSSGGPLIGPAPAIGTLTVRSSIGVPTDGAFTAESTKNNPGFPDNGNPIGTTGFVPVPVPEPTTVLLMLTGPLFVFGAVRRGLRRRQA
jgi:hypothetical protein